MQSKTILYLAAYLPVLGMHGGGTRMFHNLRILAEKHRVILLCFTESEEETSLLEPLARLGMEVKPILRIPCSPNNWLMPRPREHDEYASPEMKRLVRDVLSRETVDVIQAEYLQMGQQVPEDFHGLKILTEHEVHFANFWTDFRSEKRVFPKLRRYYDWLVQFNYEVRTCRRFDRVVCMTEADARRLSQFVESRKLLSIPIGVDCHYFGRTEAAVPQVQHPRLIFVGNYRHIPNRDAVTYFVRKIFPSVRQAVPEAEFRIVGANTPLLDLPDQPGVVRQGYAEDLRQVYDSAAVFVSPIRLGNGMRVKLLEAFSMEMAVVSTSLAASGFGIQADQHLLIANSTAEFVRQTVRLLKDPGLCHTLGRNARRLVEEKYDWKVLANDFLKLVEVSNG